MRHRNLYRVIIVEDETPILDNLIEKLLSLDLPLQLVGTATDGEQALELIRMQKPHILFTDIKIPIMDGLTLLEKALQLYPSLRAVIISGYNDFEYARRAIKYGVTDYLLKPVSIADLERTAAKLCDSLTEQSIIKQRQIIMTQLFGDERSESLPSDFAGDSFNIYLFCIGSFYDRCYSAVDPERIARLWEKLDLPQLIRKKTTPDDRWWLVSEKQPNCRILITTVCQTRPDESLFTQAVERLGSEAALTVCGINDPVRFTEIWQVVQQLREMLDRRLVPAEPQFIVFAQPEVTEIFFPAQQQQLNELLLACRARQSQSVSQQLRVFLTTCRDGKLSQRKLEQWLLRLVDEIEATAIADIDSATLRIELLSAIVSESNVEQLYSTLFNLLREAVNNAYRVSESIATLADSIRQYLNDRYLEPITMETVAEVFHFSSSYITRIFKKQYGVPPFRYLLGLRITEAKCLIEKNDDLNIASIAQAVGYDDQHYFSRIFKSMTGLSPSEYKKREF